MTDSKDESVLSPRRPPPEHDWTAEELRRRQTRRGLEMTPAERLRWLEETVAELREIQGRARRH